MDYDRCSEDLTTPHVVVHENTRKFRINNPQGILVKKIRVDGCLIHDHRPRCDYVFELGQGCDCAIYLELKGADIEKAISQLIATMGHIKERHNATTIVCHIVASRVPRAGTKLQNLKLHMARKHKAQLYVGTQQVVIDLRSAPYCSVRK